MARSGEQDSRLGGRETMQRDPEEDEGMNQRNQGALAIGQDGAIIHRTIPIRMIKFRPLGADLRVSYRTFVCDLNH
jgi:hypothetical protein